MSKMIRRKEMLTATGLKATTQWRLESLGQFPARRMISKGICGWIESEVQDWIEGRQAVTAATMVKPPFNEKREVTGHA